MARRGAWGSLPEHREECRTWVAGGMEEAKEGEEAQWDQLGSSHPAIAFELPLPRQPSSRDLYHHVASIVAW